MALLMEDGDCFEQLSAATTRHTGDKGIKEVPAASTGAKTQVAAE